MLELGFPWCVVLSILSYEIGIIFVVAKVVVQPSFLILLRLWDVAVCVNVVNQSYETVYCVCHWMVAFEM